jgi:hypothetical protein
MTTIISKELNWLMKAAKYSKEYTECIEKKFTGRLPYRMIMNAIQKNKWSNKAEGGQGKNAYWSVSNTENENVNYSIYYNCYSSVVEFTIYEAKLTFKALTA